MKKISTFFCVLLCAGALAEVTAQTVATRSDVSQSSRVRLRPVAELDFQTWFDNREYKSESTPDQTLFGLKLTPEIGLSWNDNNRIMIGTDLRVNFGDKPFRQDWELIAYYNYKSDDQRFSAYAGIFPRNKMIGEYYSRVFVSDSVRYYDSNLEGFMLSYRGSRWHVELAMDWLNMINGSEREKFMILSSGSVFSRNYKWFAGYEFSMFHHSISHIESGVVDNLLAYPHIGFSLIGRSSRKTLYSNYLRIKAGWIQAMQKDRQVEDKFRTPGGVQVEINACHKSGFGFDNTLYLGDNLMPYYAKYGSGLYMGDAFYRTTGDVYNRLQVYWVSRMSRYMRLMVSSVHHYDGHKWGWQQLATLSVYLNGKNSRW